VNPHNEQGGGEGRLEGGTHTVIHWLTGYTEKGLQNVLDKNVDFRTFPQRRDEASSPRRRNWTPVFT